MPIRAMTSAKLSPAARTRTRTSPRPGAGSGVSRTWSTSGPPALVIHTARTCASRALHSRARWRREAGTRVGAPRDGGAGRLTTGPLRPISFPRTATGAPDAGEQEAQEERKEGPAEGPAGAEPARGPSARRHPHPAPEADGKALEPVRRRPAAAPGCAAGPLRCAAGDPESSARGPAPEGASP